MFPKNSKERSQNKSEISMREYIEHYVTNNLMLCSFVKKFLTINVTSPLIITISICFYNL